MSDKIINDRELVHHVIYIICIRMLWFIINSNLYYIFSRNKFILHIKYIFRRLSFNVWKVLLTGKHTIYVLY